ncbi:MAG: hypothetical protein OIF56_07725 [Cohaesibacter sp.]|nr:hypothetical protein [Cohaesibacter sp.]MCV6603627.1 hypothetical protein [Cohaesibacter sp.]
MTDNGFSLLHKQLISYLSDIHTGWSIGSFGAIAEFHQRPSDQLLIDHPEKLVRISEKGGIALNVDRLCHIQALAYETLSPRPNRWTHGLVLCMEKMRGHASGRANLTELGEDIDAPRACDRASLLFDMGLDLANVDFCIRTQDAELIALLRAQEGRSLFEAGNPAMMAILKHHPHRVAISRIGRVEVYQKIGGPETGGVSPDGPHTHVLPKLLRTGRTHSANIPVPDDLIPVASIHPASAVYDELARDIDFNQSRFEHFQKILALYGTNDYVMEKLKLFDAAHMTSDPATFEPTQTRLGRVAVKVALRQLDRLAQKGDDNLSRRWIDDMRLRFDKFASQDQMDDELLGHKG